MAWTIEPIALHRVKVPGPEVLFQRGFGEMIDIMIYAFVLRSGGQVCLVDTGLPANYSQLNKNIRERKGAASGFVDVGMPLPQELRRRRLEPNLLVLTSFGPYATGHLGAWPHCPLWVSERGCNDLDQPEEPALAHAATPAVRERLRSAQRVVGSKEILPGLTFVEVGIHHPASAGLFIETDDGVVAIADPVFTARNLLQGTALGAAERAAGWHGMVRMLGQRCDAIIPIHDMSAAPVPRARWHASVTAKSVT